MTKIDIFILSLLKERHKLKITTLYNILKGKKTSSILGYAYFYQLLPYFGLFKELEKDSFLHLLHRLEEKHLLRISNDWVVADDSLYSLEIPEEKWEFLNPLNLGGTGEENWNVFLFALQVVSEKIHHHKDYEPILDSYLKQQQIKIWLHKNQLHEVQQQRLFYEEIKKIFSMLPENIANQLSLQFHGYEMMGFVPQQIYQEAYPFNYLTFLNDIHAFFIEAAKSDVPILRSLFLESPNSLQKTAMLIKKGLNFQELVEVRKDLKESTLRDHIIELAIRNPKNFPFSRFISENAVEVGKKFSEVDYRNWTFQDFSNENVDFLSYRLLQIRLQEDRDVLRR